MKVVKAALVFACQYLLALPMFVQYESVLYSISKHDDKIHFRNVRNVYF